VSSRRDAVAIATKELETLLFGITGSDEAARLELERALWERSSFCAALENDLALAELADSFS